jgi:hypothetical protein
MAAAVATGLFTLGGVIVGPLVNGAATDALERRREGWAAQKDARLFMLVMRVSLFAMAEALEDEWQWDDPSVVVKTNLADWDDQFAMSSPRRCPSRLVHRLPSRAHPPEMTHAAPRDGTRIGQEDADYLRGLIDNRWRRWRRWRQWPFRALPACAKWSALPLVPGFDRRMRTRSSPKRALIPAV